MRYAEDLYDLATLDSVYIGKAMWTETYVASSNEFLQLVRLI